MCTSTALSCVHLSYNVSTSNPSSFCVCRRCTHGDVCVRHVQVLPLCTLYQHLTTFTCRDLQRSVDGRILKVRILTDLGLLHEAFVTLQRLLYGERLPHMEDSNFRQVEGKVPQYKFYTSKPMLEPHNLKVCARGL